MHLCDCILHVRVAALKYASHFFVLVVLGDVKEDYVYELKRRPDYKKVQAYLARHGDIGLASILVLNTYNYTCCTTN